jgi:tetratricopeptide (TPR) repeat protein
MSRILLTCGFFLVLPLPTFADDFDRGKEALDNGDDDLAIACFTACIRDHPKSAAAYYNRGLAYGHKQEYDKAIQDFSEAIRLDPKYARAYTNRGAAYGGKKEYDKEIEDCSEAIRLDPKYVLSYSNRGFAYSLKKEYDKAIQDCSEAIRLNPKFALSYSNRGFAYSLKKEYDKAIQDFSEAIRLNPKEAFSYHRLARLLATCPKDSVRDGHKAIELATKACELSRWKDADYLETLAAADAEIKNFKEAVKWQKKALEVGHYDEEDMKKARQRLKLYEAEKPYRDE